MEKFKLFGRADAKKKENECERLLLQTTEIVNNHTEVRSGIMRTDSQMIDALVPVEQAIEMCPKNLGLLMIKALIERGASQFKTAEETIDRILQADPSYFEARMWKDHWNTWSTALQFPYWDEFQTSLNSYTTEYLSKGISFQIVRNGLQKAPALFSVIQGPPFGKGIDVKLHFVLSETPYGPIVAYYERIFEPGDQPSTQEKFLPIYRPESHIPMEQYYLMQQLALSNFIFVVYLSQSGSIMFNKKIVFSDAESENIKKIAAKLRTAGKFLAKSDSGNAMQWHMNHFKMEDLKF